LPYGNMITRRFMDWLFLFCASIVYFAYAFLAFSESFDKSSTSFFVISMVVGFFYSLLWYFSTIIITTKEKFFTFTLAWDFVYMAVFYFTPVLLFGVKMDRFSVTGLICMVIGLVIMKLGH